MWSNQITADNAGWRTQFYFLGSSDRPGVAAFYGSAAEVAGSPSTNNDASACCSPRPSDGRGVRGEGWPWHCA